MWDSITSASGASRLIEGASNADVTGAMQPSEEPPTDIDELGAMGPAVPSAAEASALIERLPAIVYVSEVGVDGHWHYISGQAEQILGFAPWEWLQDRYLWKSRVHPDDRERVFLREERLEDPQTAEEYRMLHRDGRTIWVRDDAALITDEYGKLHWHGVISDITERKLTESELELRAAQQAAVAVLGSRALEGLDLSELMDEAVREATRILGVDCGAVLELGPPGTPPLIRAGSRPADEAAMLSGSELPNGLKSVIGDRSSAWGLLCVQSSSPRRYTGADIDFVHALANVLAGALQRRGTEEDIRSQALRDPLTGLPNRALVLDRVEQARLRPRGPVAVLMLDVDRFKRVNDNSGHAAGDELLCAIAPRVREVLRPGDTIGRLGGDEFVILLEEIAGEQTATQVAERIIASFRYPFALKDGEHYATVSIGIAVAMDGWDASEMLIRDADAALYRAKEQGRARYELFDSAMRERASERLSVESDLHRALERNELRIVYQPVVSLCDDSISCIEALVRWQHPTRGLLSPGDFISVAEESGLIGPIGEWVLEESCRQTIEWQAIAPDLGAMGLSVNLSARQLSQQDLPSAISRVLQVTGLDPSCLYLEITEAALLEDSSTVDQTIRLLASSGVKIVLDDFGTSYSSLDCLTRLPISGLKIDRSFTQLLAHDESSTAIVTAIVKMAQALSITVIAEGVETALQAEELRRINCEEAQGFYFARPMPAEQLVKVLSERARAPRRHAAHV